MRRLGARLQWWTEREMRTTEGSRPGQRGMDGREVERRERIQHKMA